MSPLHVTAHAPLPTSSVLPLYLISLKAPSSTTTTMSTEPFYSLQGNLLLQRTCGLSFPCLLLESNDTTRPSPHLQWERNRIKCSSASHPMGSESPFFVSFTVSLTFIQGDCINAYFYVPVLPSFLELTLLFPCFFLSCFSGPRASPTVPVALVV